MTVTDHLSEDDLLLLTEPEPDTAAARRELPPGAEAMARPWRLGVIGIGVTIGLIARLLAANGYFSINSRTLVIAAAVTSLLAGIGLIAVASERDRFDRWMVLLAAGTGLSLGALQWVSPYFASGTLEWSNADQAALALLGLGNGVLLAGILTLAFVRRWPTMTVVGVLAAGVLALAADSVLLRNEWPSIAALALAFGGVLLAWDQAPRHEPAYPKPPQAPRISRAALSLATVAIGGSVLQLWISRGESVRRVLPAAILSVVLIALAFLAMIRLRREIQRRKTSLNEWTSWMREIRTGDLRNDFETLGTTASGGLIGDVTGEAPRPLSFPDLRVDEAPTAAPAEAPVPAEAVPAKASPAEPEAAEAPATAPTIDIPQVVEAPGIPLPDAGQPTIPVADVPVEAAGVQPRLFGDEPPAASDLVWADDLEDPTIDTPIVSAEQPSLFDFESEPGTGVLYPSAEDTAPIPVATPPAPTAPPAPAITAPAFTAPAIPLPPSVLGPVTAPEPVAASSFSNYLGSDDDGAAADAADVAAAAGLASAGAFTSWLGDAPVARVLGGVTDLARWLATEPAAGATRLIAAVETMSLADFDELPTEVSAAANDAMLERLRALEPAPSVVAAIDGPYLMAAWDTVAGDYLPEINRTVLDAMSTPVPTEFGAVGLTGTLAFLRPGDGTTIDDVIDQAIQGLVQARQLEALAAQPR